MKLWILLLALALAIPVRADVPHNVLLYQPRLGGHRLAVVEVNLRCHRVAVRPLVAPAGLRDFTSLLGPRPPEAAITGTFFDTATSLVIGSIASQGCLLQEGAVGNTLAIDHHGQACLLSTAGRMGRYLDWSGFDFAISSGPTLVRDGRLVVSPQLEGFHDAGLFGPRRRTALGITARNKLLLVGVDDPVSLHELAHLMLALGAVQAVNMDGGSSSALYYRGRVLLSPQRQLTNLVAVYEGEPEPPLPQGLPRLALDHYWRGLACLARGRALLARSQFAWAVALSPWQARFRTALALADRGLGLKPAAADQYLRAAELYMAGGLADRALDTAAQGARLDTRRPDLQLVLARAACQAGQRGLAREALGAVLARCPGHPEALELLSRVEPPARTPEPLRPAPAPLPPQDPQQPILPACIGLLALAGMVVQGTTRRKRT